YYRVDIIGDNDFPMSDEVLATSTADNQKLRWTSIANLQPEGLTFPIDRVVARLLKKGAYLY
ncbi:MAG: hypothetical protein LC643_03235, partial [Bacteroidales bacterium]|nr:hypothetical protein [Bacteroidales bacterium]